MKMTCHTRRTIGQSIKRCCIVSSLPPFHLCLTKFIFVRITPWQRYHVKTLILSGTWTFQMHIFAKTTICIDQSRIHGFHCKTTRWMWIPAEDIIMILKLHTGQLNRQINPRHQLHPNYLPIKGNIWRQFTQDLAKVACWIADAEQYYKEWGIDCREAFLQAKDRRKNGPLSFY